MKDAARTFEFGPEESLPKADPDCPKFEDLDGCSGEDKQKLTRSAKSFVYSGKAQQEIESVGDERNSAERSVLMDSHSELCYGLTTGLSWQELSVNFYNHEICYQ